MPLPLIIGAAGAIGGSLLGKAAGVGGPSPQQTQLTNQQIANLSQLSGLSGTTFNRGSSLLDLSSSNFAAPSNYFSGILSGNQGSITSALAPEIQQINSSNTAARTSAEALFPRSGMSTSERINSIFAPQQQISSLMQTVRPQAASALAGIAGTEGSLGAGLTSSSLAGLSSGTSAGTGVANNLLQQQMFQAQQQNNLGGGIGTLLYFLTKGLKNP